jgi:L-histidine N-alpha-methyltransferase
MEQPLAPTSPGHLTDRRCAIGLGRPQNQKFIPIDMLYENGGSLLYAEIVRHPAYYPYRTEKALLERHASEIIGTIRPGTALVELGCGDCTKTRILLNALAARDGHVEFAGIDVSAEGLAVSRSVLAPDPRIRFTAVHAPFFEGLARASRLYPEHDLCVLMLGSTLGNMPFDDARLFLKNVFEMLCGHAGRVRIVLGLDLWKEEGRLLRAYDNEITRLFEINGLRNALLDADPGHRFDERAWRYVVEVNAPASQVEMFAQALSPQPFAGGVIEQHERILLEISHKFSEHELGHLFEGCTLDARFGEDYALCVLSCACPAATTPWAAYTDWHVAHIDRVARLDYAAFVRSHPFGDGGPLRVLDIGCGSAAVPNLLRSCDEGSRRFAQRIERYDLLDISANSLRIASQASPFHVGRKYHSAIERFDECAQFGTARSAYDLVWSVHGVTAVNPSELWRTLLNMITATAPGGRTVVVMSDRASHYAQLDRAYLEDCGEQPPRGSFLVAEDVVAMLQAHGVPHQVAPVCTGYVFDADEVEAWKVFNAWCVYDHAFDITLGGPAVARYLASCRTDGGHRLTLTSLAITIERDALTPLLWRARRAEVPRLEPEPYARACAAFLACSTQRTQIVAQFSQRGVLARTAAASQAPLRVLSIGCGDGHADAAMLAAGIGDGFTGPVHYTGVDSSAQQRARCAETLAALCRLRPGGALRAEVLDPAAFAARGDHGPYDCVLMLHLLYYVKEWMETLRSAYERLRVGGRLMIWQAPREAINRLAGVFWNGQHEHAIPFAAEIEAFLCAQGWPFTARRIDAALRLPDDAAERSDVLSFLLHADHERLADDVRAGVAEAIDALRGADDTLPHPVVAFAVERA